MAYSDSTAQTSAVLNVFMYIDNKYTDEFANKGMSLKCIVEKMSEIIDPSDTANYENLMVVKKAIEDNSDIGALKLIDSSSNTDDFRNTETNGCLFKDPNSNSVYVSYKGTADGEWPDDGKGMTQESTIQQKRAADYFDYLAQRYGLNKDQNIVITGHSKGGNKAQYAYMASDNNDLIDSCYSMDGEGFSDKAIDTFKRKHGEAGYEQKINNIYGVNGNNDPVNEMGIRIITDDNERYIDAWQSDNVKDAAWSTHDIKYFFYDKDNNPRGHLNSYTLQGPAGHRAADLSKRMMNMDEKTRESTCNVIMGLVEKCEGRQIGINGEQADALDYIIFITAGIPLIFNTDDNEFMAFVKYIIPGQWDNVIIDFTKDMINIIKKYFENIKFESYSNAVFYINCGNMEMAAEDMNDFAGYIMRTKEGIENVRSNINYDILSAAVLNIKLQCQINALENQYSKLEHMKNGIDTALSIYQQTEDKIKMR